MAKKEYRLPPSSLASKDFKFILENYPSKTRREVIPLGIDANNNCCYKNISDLEDILIGGTTSSGKSNLLHYLICSILMKHKPTETKLVLIDTKGYEFNNYTRVPHLLTPIVTNKEDANKILNSLIKGAENRRKIFDKKKVKNFNEYNNLVRKELKKDPTLKTDHLPNIFLIIDDYALIDNKENKEKIEELLKINNYTGIHVISGTSIPKPEVISKTMLNYFLSRVSFHFVEDEDIKFILGTKEDHQVDGVNNYILKTNDNKIYNLRCPLLKNKEIETIIDYIGYANDIKKED